MNIDEAIHVAEIGLPGYKVVLERFNNKDTIKQVQSMQSWCNAIRIWAKEKGWEDKERSFDEWIALFHTEISEAYEEYRNGHAVDEVYFINDSNGVPKPEGIAIEIADELIRIFHFASFFNLNLNELVNLKMGYNATRPYRHGEKKS